MRKNVYRAVELRQVEAERVLEALEGHRVVVGIDVAKEDEVATLMDDTGRVHWTVKWKHPGQSRGFLDLLCTLGDLGAAVETVMEPTGSYSDALRDALLKAGIPVFRVSPKRCHDAAEVYDGVPSSHDAKAAAIIGKLHLDGASEVWSERTAAERSAAASARIVAIHCARYQRSLRRLDSVMVRHWPELTRVVKLDRLSVLKLLAAYGTPRAVAEDEAGAHTLLREASRGQLRHERVEELVASARTSMGASALEEERQMVMELASDTLAVGSAVRRARARAQRLLAEDSVTQRMSEIVGPLSAVMLMASLGAPSRYGSAGAYVRALGLNLVERSSGHKKGRLHISRRGPGTARRYLWLAAVRRVHRDDVVRAWYDKKVERDGGVRKKALVAVMRKLARGMWHVARNESASFETRKLFNTTPVAELTPVQK